MAAWQLFPCLGTAAGNFHKRLTAELESCFIIDRAAGFEMKWFTSGLIGVHLLADERILSLPSHLHTYVIVEEQFSIE
jgi:hypothetical protein